MRSYYEYDNFNEYDESFEFIYGCPNPDDFTDDLNEYDESFEFIYGCANPDDFSDGYEIHEFIMRESFQQGAGLGGWDREGFNIDGFDRDDDEIIKFVKNYQPITAMTAPAA